MLSSDKNVASIAELVEALKQYVGLQKEYLELNVIEKIVKLVTALTMAIVFVLLACMLILYAFYICAVCRWFSTQEVSVC